MPFDSKTSPIAITIPEFSMKKKISDPGRYCEPYIVSFAVDQQGNANPELLFNLMPFPKVEREGKVVMMGDGHLIYGPKNPGEWVAISVLFMESDRDIRAVGEEIEAAAKSKAAELGLATVTAANATAGAVLAIVKEIALHVGGILKRNKDDELIRRDGSFLRDHPCPFHINRQYEFQNDYVKFKLQVIPLTKSNGEGSEMKAIKL